MKNLAIAAIASLMIFSCTPMKQSGIMKSEQESLIGTSWKLADKVSGKVPTLAFEEGRINGNAGCNNFFGELQAQTSTGSLKFDKMGSTKMMCDPAAMETENNLMAVLPKVNRYNISGNTLELYQDKLLLLKFTAAK